MMSVRRSTEDIHAASTAALGEDTCSICRQTLADTASMTETVCRHRFHKTCISNYARTNQNCPVCGVRVTKDVGALTSKSSQKVNSPVTTRSVAKAKNFDAGRSTDGTAPGQNPLNSSPADTSPASSTVSVSALKEVVTTIVSEQHTQLLSVLSTQISALVEKSVEAGISRLNSVNSIHASHSSSPQTGGNPRMHALPDVEQRTLEQLLGIQPRNLNQSHNANLHGSSNAGQEALDVRPSHNGTMTDLLFRPDRISQILHNWKLKFNGSSNCLPVDSFIYRAEALTKQTLNGNFEILCGNASMLFEGKASDWFWRFHKSVGNFQWSDLCRALREQYRDSRTDMDFRELIRDRKQKPNELFDVFYESVIDLVDRLNQPLSDRTLVEILRRNLLPEIQHEILNMKIDSVGQLREVCRRREFFIQDMKNRHSVVSNKSHNFSRRVSELDVAGSEGPELLELDEVAEVNLTCWNCKQSGHRYQDCVADRTIFCYGCGMPDTYKPNCRKCASNSKNFRSNPPKGASRVNSPADN